MFCRGFRVCGFRGLGLWVLGLRLGVLGFLDGF